MTEQEQPVRTFSEAAQRINIVSWVTSGRDGGTGGDDGEWQLLDSMRKESWEHVVGVGRNSAGLGRQQLGQPTPSATVRRQQQISFMTGGDTLSKLAMAAAAVEAGISPYGFVVDAHRRGEPPPSSQGKHHAGARRPSVQQAALASRCMSIYRLDRRGSLTILSVGLISFLPFLFRPASLFPPAAGEGPFAGADCVSIACDGLSTVRGGVKASHLGINDSWSFDLSHNQSTEYVVQLFILEPARRIQGDVLDFQRDFLSTPDNFRWAMASGGQLTVMQERFERLLGFDPAAAAAAGTLPPRCTHVNVRKSDMRAGFFSALGAQPNHELLLTAAVFCFHPPPDALSTIVMLRVSESMSTKCRAFCSVHAF